MARFQINNFLSLLVIVLLSISLLPVALSQSSSSSSSSSAAVAAVNVCAVPAIITSQSVTNCTINGYDLSPLTGIDLYGLNSANSQFVFRLCGAVADTHCQPGSQLCQFGTASPYCTNAATTLLYVNGSQTIGFINNNATQGLNLTAVGADQYCTNGANMTVNIILACGGSVIPVKLTSITSTGGSGCQCSTTITLTTSLACPASMNYTAAPAAAVSTAQSVSCHAGQFGIDLSSQFSSDIYYRTSSGLYSINLCGPSTFQSCTRYAGPTAMSCLAPLCNNVSVSSLMFTSEIPTWSYTNTYNLSGGLTMFTYNPSSTACGMIVRLFCNATATSPFITSVYVSPSCVTNIFISTSLMCVNESAMPVLPKPHCTSGCCGLGYDFSSMATHDIFGWEYNEFPFAFRMCGPVNSTTTCNGASMCQYPTCSVAYGASYATTSLTTTSWSFVNGIDFTGGVRMLVVNGDWCGVVNAPRAINIVFVCDPDENDPRMMTIAETTTCVYSATIRTSVVCPSPPYLGGASTVGIANFSTVGSIAPIVTPAPTLITSCYHDGYDFSPLSTYDFYTIASGYVYISRICGPVTDQMCNSNPSTVNSSVCQIYTGCGSIESGYRVANWNPYVVQWRYPTGDWTGGIQLSLQTGDVCNGNDTPRMIRWWFICDPNVTSVRDTTVVEEAGQYFCHYDVTIRTNIVCTEPNSVRYINASSSSSSSTGVRLLAQGAKTNGATSLSSSSVFHVTIVLLLLVTVSISVFA